MVTLPSGKIVIFKYSPVQVLFPFLQFLARKILVSVACESGEAVGLAAPKVGDEVFCTVESSVPFCTAGAGCGDGVLVGNASVHDAFFSTTGVVCAVLGVTTFVAEPFFSGYTGACGEDGTNVTFSIVGDLKIVGEEDGPVSNGEEAGFNKSDSVFPEFG